MSQRPGIMFYFDLLPSFTQLSDPQLAALVRAALFYGHDGVLPEFRDPTLLALWPILRERVERDEERYQQIVDVRTKAAQRRWAKTPDPQPARSTSYSNAADYANSLNYN